MPQSQSDVMQLKRKVSFASQGGSHEGDPGQPRSLPTLTRGTSVRSPSPSKGRLVKARTPPVLMSAFSPALTTTTTSQHSQQQSQQRNTNLLELSQMFQQMQSVVTNRGPDI